MKKSVLLLAILIAFVGVGAEAQEARVQSRYGDSFPASVANQVSNITGYTLVGKRDFGIDLFIGGVSLLFVAAPLILVPPLLIRSISSSPFVILGVGIAAGVAAITGLGTLIAGAVYWGEANAELRAASVGVQENGTDVLLSFDGTGVRLRY